MSYRKVSLSHSWAQFKPSEARSTRRSQEHRHKRWMMTCEFIGLSVSGVSGNVHCPGASVTMQNNLRSKDLGAIGVVREEDSGDGGTNIHVPIPCPDDIHNILRFLFKLKLVPLGCRPPANKTHAIV